MCFIKKLTKLVFSLEVPILRVQAIGQGATPVVQLLGSIASCSKNKQDYFKKTSKG